MYSEQFEAFKLSCILFDGTINKSTHFLKIEQISKDLIEFKRDVFNNNLKVDRSIRISPSRIDKNGVNHKETYAIEYGSFHNERAMVYWDNKHKIVTKEMAELIVNSPLALAIMFADDGYTVLVGKESGKIYNRRLEICTESFPIESTQNLIDALNAKFDFNCTLTARKRINFKTKDAQLFVMQIYPFFKNFPSLMYKLNLGYSKSALENPRYIYPEYSKFVKEELINYIKLVE